MLSQLALIADAVGTPLLFLFECSGACVSEIVRRRRARRPTTVILALALCALILLWSGLQTSTVVASMGRGASLSTDPLPPAAHNVATARSPPPPAARSSAPTVTQRLAVTIRSQHSGRYWQVLGDEAPTRRAGGSAADAGAHAVSGARLRLSASAPPEQRGHERTVFLLEREGEPEEGGWVLLRWLKTRQLIEAIPPGVPGREDDAWTVRLSAATSVNELHKLTIEDDAAHSQSHIWSFGLHGYLNELDASGEVVGHGDSLPPTLATEPPKRGAVSVERLQTGAAWLMEALEQRDRQLDSLQQQLGTPES